MVLEVLCSALVSCVKEGRLCSAMIEMYCSAAGIGVMLARPSLYFGLMAMMLAMMLACLPSHPRHVEPLGLAVR